jgi:hypothetical protein
LARIDWRALPAQVKGHLIDRLVERRISKADVETLRAWIETDPMVPDGLWYKDFGTFKLAGNGNKPSTFLMKGQAARGQRVD